MRMWTAGWERKLRGGSTREAWIIDYLQYKKKNGREHGVATSPDSSLDVTMKYATP